MFRGWLLPVDRRKRVTRRSTGIRSRRCRPTHRVFGRRSAFGAKGNLLIQNTKPLGLGLDRRQFFYDSLFFVLEQYNIISR
jgi:hypothetical protein